MQVEANGIQLEVEVHGDAGEPLVLIRGLGTQLIHWHRGFLEGLVARGYRVICFDNRDVGRSTWFDHAAPPDLGEVLGARLRGETPAVPYTVSDMARDVVGLLDALDLARAHVMGISMGGMIAQTLAIEHAARVASLVSVMSSTGEPDLPRATPEATAALMEAAPRERDAYLDYFVRTSRVFGSPGYPETEAALRDLGGRAYDRAFHPEGVARQSAAVLASPGRRVALGALAMPAVVVHGADDPLIPLGCGEDTARAIPQADLVVVPGMGHDLPEGVWPAVHDAIGRATRGAT